MSFQVKIDGHRNESSSKVESNQRQRSLSGSLDSDHENDLMASGNFTFVLEAKRAKQKLMNCDAHLLSCQMNNPAEIQQPLDALKASNARAREHIEVVAVTQIQATNERRVSENSDSALSSDSETEYEEVPSDEDDEDSLGRSNRYVS